VSVAESVPKLVFRLITPRWRARSAALLCGGIPSADARIKLKRLYPTIELQ
jgi:hypothetical protein